MKKPTLTHPTLAFMGVVKPYSEIIDPHTTRHLDPPPHLVKNFLVKGSVTGLTAMPGVGKSWLAFEIMRAVNMGGKVMGEFECEQGGVLFVGSDASIHDYAYQWRRLTNDEFNSFQTAGDEVINPYAGCRWLMQSSFTLENPHEVCKLVKTHDTFEAGDLQQVIVGYTTENDPDDPDKAVLTPQYDMLSTFVGFKLIVFDTFSRLFRGNQNDAAEVERAMGHMKLIAEYTGAAVVVLHHNSKPTEFNDGTDARGSSAFVGALDGWLNLTAKKGDKHYLRGTWKKFRGITPPDFDYRQEVMDPVRASLKFLDAVEAGPPGSDNLTQGILELLASVDEPLTSAEIRARLWSTFSDIWKDERSFNNAVHNRTHGSSRPDAIEKIATPGKREVKFALKKGTILT